MFHLLLPPKFRAWVCTVHLKNGQCVSMADQSQKGIRPMVTDMKQPLIEFYKSGFVYSSDIADHDKGQFKVLYHYDRKFGLISCDLVHSTSSDVSERSIGTIRPVRKWHPLMSWPRRALARLLEVQVRGSG